MKLYGNIFFHFLIVFTVSFVGFQGYSANAQQNQNGNPKMDVWNPTKVDWWVSANDSKLNNVKGCEIHWLFDDHMDVMLYSNDDNRLLFTFSIKPKAKNIKPALNLKTGMAQDATLIIDNVKHGMGVTDVDLTPVTVIMALSSVLNDINLVQKSDRLLIKIDNVIYNFPLENIEENVSFFKQCLAGAGGNSQSTPSQKNIAVASVAPAAPVSPILDTSLPYSDSVEIEPLPSPVKEEVEPVLPVVNESVISQADQALLEPKKLQKQSDDILKDMQYAGDKVDEKKVKDKEEKAQDSCKNDAYGEEGTAVIRNLTRKLVILEKEKEELRLKAMGVSDNQRIADIIECGTKSLEPVEDPIGEEILAKFETTISSLREENEMLKQALAQAEEIDNSEMENKVKELNAQVADLIKKNYQLESQVINKQMKSSKDVAKSLTQEEEISEIERILNDNAALLEAPLKPNLPDVEGEDTNKEALPAKITDDLKAKPAPKDTPKVTPDASIKAEAPPKK